MQNPFITSTEVYADEDFFDREDVLREVEDFINRPRDFNLLLFGQRRVGKSSLLRRIQKIYEQKGFISIYYSLQGEAESTLNQLLKKIAQRLIKKLNCDLQIPETVDKEYFLGEFLDKLKEKLQDQTLLLLFDEFDVLGMREDMYQVQEKAAFHQFVIFLPDLIQKIKDKEVPIKLIFAIGRNYKDLDTDRFGQIYKFGQQIEIKFFEKETVFRLLSLSDEIIPFTEAAKEKVWQISGGQPYFTQCLASVAFEYTDRNDFNQIDEQVVEAVFDETIRRYSGGVYWIWDTIKKKDKIILYFAAKLKEDGLEINESNIKQIAEKNGFVAVTKDINRSLATLININFLKEKDKKLVFTSEFFRKWIIKEITQSDLKNYYKDFDIEIKQYLNNIGHFKSIIINNIDVNEIETKRHHNEIENRRYFYNENYKDLIGLVKNIDNVLILDSNNISLKTTISDLDLYSLNKILVTAIDLRKYQVIYFILENIDIYKTYSLLEVICNKKKILNEQKIKKILYDKLDVDNKLLRIIEPAFFKNVPSIIDLSILVVLIYLAINFFKTKIGLFLSFIIGILIAGFIIDFFNKIYNKSQKFILQHRIKKMYRKKLEKCFQNKQNKTV